MRKSNDIRLNRALSHKTVQKSITISVGIESHIFLWIAFFFSYEVNITVTDIFSCFVTAVYITVLGANVISQSVLFVQIIVYIWYKCIHKKIVSRRYYEDVMILWRWYVRVVLGTKLTEVLLSYQNRRPRAV